jgi:mRNA-degrading endonuclease RelE of RelBE toxin-antitoxin system
MAYNLTILPQAAFEIQKAFEYYELISDNTFSKFNNQLEEVYQNLEKNPFYQVRYKHLRAIPFKSFPYLVFFDVDQENKIVYIYSVFHTSQNPNKYPLL